MSEPDVRTPSSEVVTCPECGNVAAVTLKRRDSVDFCRHCDFPLFWTPSQVVIDRGDAGDESLRRLPGTVGAAQKPSLGCPHCAEPNLISATTCIRCGLPLYHVEQPSPVFVPVEEAEDEPPPALPVPTPWWMWFGTLLAVVLPVLLVVLYTTEVI